MDRKSRCERVERLPWVHDDPRKAFVFVQVVHKGGVVFAVQPVGDTVHGGAHYCRVRPDREGVQE